MVKLYGKHAELIAVGPSELCNWSLELLLSSAVDQSGDSTSGARKSFGY